MRVVPAKRPPKATPGIVGQNVRRLRLAWQPRSLSKARLAQLAGVAESTISNIELGYIEEPSVDTVRRLARALGVTDTDLLLPHGQSPLEPAIATFLESEYSRRMPGGPVTAAEVEWLRSFPAATWERLPPNPEALHHIILARRMNPDIA